MFDMLINWLGHPITWIEILVIGMVTEIMKTLMLGPKSKWPKDGFTGWRGVYFVTYRAHALLIGAVFGLVGAYLIPLPVPEKGFEGTGGILAYHVGNAALAMVLYAALVGVLIKAVTTYLPRALSRFAGKAANGRPTSPPPPPSEYDDIEKP